MSKAKTTKPAKPATLAEMADFLFKAQSEYTKAKKAAEAKLEALKTTRDELEALVLKMMLDAQQEAVSTKRATIAIRRTTFAELYDDKAFFGYVGKTKSWDLVRKQPVVSACRERWDDQQEIPGVRPGTKSELSITARAKA